jgi:hypothetical protein
MEVEFVPWTKYDIVDRLASSPDRRGFGLFWFNSEIFDQQWFASNSPLQRLISESDFSPVIM